MQPWTCPVCARTVPGRIDTCYCGRERPVGTPAAVVKPAGRSTTKLASAAAAVALIGVGVWYSQRAGAPAVPTSPSRPAHAAETLADAAAPPIDDVIERATPSVVMVQTPTARGSGFFAGPDLIVTNARILGGVATAAITVRGGTRVDGKVVFQAEARELAFVEIPKEAGAFPSLPLGRSAGVHPGQAVIALGWADGQTQSTAARGVVTALRHDANQTLLQTSAAPNRGDAGGPLLDRSGNVIGVATFRADGDATESGLAIAIDDITPYFAYVTRHD